MEIFEKHATNFKTYERWQLAYNKEVTALELLEENFINEPKIDHYPFPKILSKGLCTEKHVRRGELISDCYMITMTHCGIDGRENNINNKRNIEPNNLYNTVECIINNLRNIRLMHKDITRRNICINKNGDVSLIDFDHCHSSGKSADRWEKQVKDFYKKPDLNHLKETLTQDLEALSRMEFIFTYKLQPWSMLYLI